MKYIISYKKFGVDLNVQDGATRQDLIQAYLEASGGPQGVLNNFLNRVLFIEDTTPDAKYSEEKRNEENKDKENKDE